jgi:hypothetical protein
MYFIHENGKPPVGPMTAQATLQFILSSNALLGKLLILDQEGKTIDLQLLNASAQEEENAQRTLK